MSVYIMMNKPFGYITAKKDERKATVMEFLPEELREKLHPVGRLDIDTVGFLLFTDNGKLDHALLMPEQHVEKSYFFYAIGTLDRDKINKIENGLYISQNGKITGLAKLTEYKACVIKDIIGFLPETRKKHYAENPQGNAFSAVLTISEGRKHQVKLMLHAVGCKIIYLKRTVFAGIALDEALSPGEWRELSLKETEIIENHLNQS